MKIAVSVICKNESKHIPDWLKVMSEADDIFVIDTGSTDNSIELLRNGGATVISEMYEPFDFSVARNDALRMVPKDYDWIVAVDFDEFFEVGWRNKLESTIQQNPEATAVWCKAESLQPNGTWRKYPDGVLKIFKNHYYKWKSRIHEHLVTDKPKVEIKCDILLKHYLNNSEEKEKWYVDICIEEFEKNGNDHALWFAIQHFINHNDVVNAEKYGRLYLISTPKEGHYFRPYILKYLILMYKKQDNFSEMMKYSLMLLCEHSALDTQNFLIETINMPSFMLFIIECFGREDLRGLRNNIIEYYKKQ